jgi:hypothetical protein
VKLLLTSGGITNDNVRNVLVEMLGKPIAESDALFVPNLDEANARIRKLHHEDANLRRALRGTAAVERRPPEPDRLSVVASRVGPRAKRVEFYALEVRVNRGASTPNRARARSMPCSRTASARRWSARARATWTVATISAKRPSACKRADGGSSGARRAATSSIEERTSVREGHPRAWSPSRGRSPRRARRAGPRPDPARLSQARATWGPVLRHDRSGCCGGS